MAGWKSSGSLCHRRQAWGNLLATARWPCESRPSGPVLALCRLAARLAGGWMDGLMQDAASRKQAVRRLLADLTHYYFFMKSDRLSPKPEEALELCPDFWSSSACRPALRFLARFLLLALADSLAGSVGAAAAAAAERFSGSTFCWSTFLLLPLALRGLGAGSCTLVYLLHLPHVKTLDVPGLCEEEAAAAGAPWALGCFLILALSALSAPILSSVPWPGIII